jgi:hypothetical protein
MPHATTPDRQLSCCKKSPTSESELISATLACAGAKLAGTHEPPVRTDVQKYLERLAAQPHKGFVKRFLEISLKLDLGDILSVYELSLLHNAVFFAALCNIAFNGLGGCNGEIRPEREALRIKLEQKYMVACDRCYDAAGWDALPEFTKESIRRIFLNVYVTENNLAG